jgi:hypothetical protein
VRRGTVSRMQAPRATATDEEMLAKFPRRARAKNWFMRVEEVSPFIYVVYARDRWGHEVKHSGTEDELDRVIEDVEKYAESISAIAT